jgi:hypothetical protein
MSLTKALSERFTDPCEIMDVARYGCSGGVSGFIYSSELYDFFEEHEDAIEDLMEEVGITYSNLVPDAQTCQQLREAAVWFAVESYCQGLANV